MIKGKEATCYTPSDYGKHYQEYSKGIFRSITPILRYIAVSCNVAFKFPVYKVLRSIAKIFLLGQIQVLYLIFIIRQTRWNIYDTLITQNCQHVKSVLFYSSQSQSYKALILYLMLTAFAVKHYFTSQSEELIEEVIFICAPFQNVFENWIKKNLQNMKVIDPKVINKLYTQINYRIRLQESDYNRLVDTIIQICPAFNPEKPGRRHQLSQDGQEVSREIEFLQGLPRKIVKRQQGSKQKQQIVFTFGSIQKMGEVVSGTIRSESQFASRIAIRSRFEGSVFGSSDLLPNSNFFLKMGQEYCEQLNLGLNDGQSEQMQILGGQYDSRDHFDFNRNIFSAEDYFSLKETRQFPRNDYN